MLSKSLNFDEIFDVLVVAMKTLRPEQDGDSGMEIIEELRMDLYSECQAICELLGRLKGWSDLPDEARLDALIKLRVELLNIRSDLDELVDLHSKVIAGV